MLTARSANLKVYHKAPQTIFMRGFFRGLCGYFSKCWLQANLKNMESLKWIDSNGGPLVLISDKSYKLWSGILKRSSYLENKFEEADDFMPLPLIL